MSVAGVFLRAEWRALAMLNYPVDPAILLPRVPSGCELDEFNGRTYVSMVGFRFLRTRVLGVPIPFHQDFDEVNLRFYVRHRATTGEWRRGVVFIKELVPKGMIAFVARTIYNEKYESLPMCSRVELPGRLRYAWWTGRWNAITVETTGTPFIPADDSEETFITEHYWGYAHQRNGSTMEYGVEHPRWHVWNCHSASFDCDIQRLYGAEFVAPLRQPPTSAFVAEGSPVLVRRGRPI